MFILRDGRECLWQWDSDVQMIVSDPTVTEVHFCNKTDDCSLVCEVFEEGGFHLVNVPNILLQSDWTIRVYAYCTNHTKVEKKFKVVARSKPADYVYTETEVQTWSKLEERMDRVEATVTTEGIAKAVEDYLEENPIETGATAEEAAQIEANTKAINELKSANYLTESELEGKGYITGIPDEYITEQELSTKGFQTAEDVATAVSDKITMDDLNTATANFVTEEQMDTAISNALSALVDGDEVSY